MSRYPHSLAEAGEYDSKLPYVERPKMPEVFKKRIAELSLAEAQSLPAQHMAYTEAVQLHDASVEARRADERRLRQLFHDDCAEFYGVKGHGMEPRIWELACMHGNSFTEIAHHYEQFSGLVTGTDPLQGLVTEFASWTKQNFLDGRGDAIELMSEKLTKKQRRWLSEFIARWENVANRRVW